MKLISSINNYALSIAKEIYFRNSYGLARSILALGTFFTLSFNSTDTLFIKGEGIQIQKLSALADISLFVLLDNYLFIAKGISLFLLFIVIIGWKPRITGIFHWYVAYSFFAHSTTIDGGDHLSSVLSLLLIPICLLDKRDWHWGKPVIANSIYSHISNLISWAFVVLIRVQVCAIYFEAGVAKTKVEEWKNGTAFFYWGLHPIHGAPEYIKPIMSYVLHSPLFVVIITWSVIVFELLLASAIMLKKDDSRRKTFLVLGILFHFSIIFIHGLVSFFFSMASALILYLYPLNQDINFNLIKLNYLKIKMYLNYGKS